MKSYLRSEGFRVFMGESVGRAMGGEAKFGVFEWQGMDVQTGEFLATTPGGLQKMEAEGVRAQLSLAGVRRGVWEVSDLRISELKVDLVTSGSQKGSSEVVVEQDSADYPPETQSSSEARGFLNGLLPDRAELMSAEVMHMNLNMRTSSGDLLFNDMAMRVDGGKVGGGYDIHLSNGVIESPWLSSPLKLQSARGKYQHGRLFLMESQSKIYERGVLTLNGELEGDSFGWFGTVRDVRCDEVLPEDWKKSVLGNIETDFKVSQRSGVKNGVVTRGKMELKQGVLTALPVLDRIAAYANSRRFRRLNLSEAQLKFKKEAGCLELTEIVIASEGLVRVEGSLSIVNGELDGRFRVGITPGTLSHIPGAETKVFLRGEKGLLWSPLRITGTVDAPKEDLSRRMIAAAGERMFELVPETGKMALKFAHETATELPQKAVETGVELIRGGGDVIKQGGDVIQEGVRGVFDLLPGGR